MRVEVRNRATQEVHSISEVSEEMYSRILADLPPHLVVHGSAVPETSVSDAAKPGPDPTELQGPAAPHKDESAREPEGALNLLVRANMELVGALTGHLHEQIRALKEGNTPPSQAQAPAAGAFEFLDRALALVETWTSQKEGDDESDAPAVAAPPPPKVVEVVQ